MCRTNPGRRMVFEVRVGMLIARPVRRRLAALVVAAAAGCTPSSQLARPWSPPTTHAPVASAPDGRFVPRPALGPTSAGGGPYTNVAQPTGRPMQGGQAGGAEVVPTPRPDSPGSGPALAPGCLPGAPGQGPVTAPPAPPRPARWWRGFLPAHGTDEDRPGWWTPDYGGGTSA